jgi:hypothetical protein
MTRLDLAGDSLSLISLRNAEGVRSGGLPSTQGNHLNPSEFTRTVRSFRVVFLVVAETIQVRWREADSKISQMR